MIADYELPKTRGERALILELAGIARRRAIYYRRRIRQISACGIDADGPELNWHRSQVAHWLERNRINLERLA